MLVLDCSVTMAWAFEDESDGYSDAALEALASTRALVPSLWPLEVANVLALAERRKRLRPADTARFVALFAALPIVVEETPFDRATSTILDLARDHKLSTYDAAYLELAMRSGARLATRDRALAKAARTAGVDRFAP